MDGFHQNGKLIDLVGLGQSSSPRVQMDQYYEPGGVESSSGKSSPPKAANFNPQSGEEKAKRRGYHSPGGGELFREELAAPPIWDCSPPPQKRELLAAPPIWDCSPPPKLRELLAAPPRHQILKWYHILGLGNQGKANQKYWIVDFESLLMDWMNFWMALFYQGSLAWLSER